MNYEDSQHIKADGGKTRPLLIEEGFARALRMVQATTDYGAIKYSANSWQDVPDGQRRYLEAAARHRQQRNLAGWLFARDQESNLPHISHELFCLMAALECALQEVEDSSPIGSFDIEGLCDFNEPPQDHKK